MTLENGDIVSITVEQSLLAEDVLNVFYYVWDVLEEGVIILDLLIEFRDFVWGFVRAGQNPEVVTNNFVGRNLTNGIDIETLNDGTIGTDVTGGDVSPSSLAAGYALNVGTLLTRPGSKRFAGTSEQRVDDNDYDAGGVVSSQIETAIAATLDVSGPAVGEGDMIPNIVGRDEFGALDLNRKQPVLTVAVAPTIRTQVSRRQG